MGWSSRAGRAHVSLTNPDAFVVSDRDGSWRNAAQMVWQYKWAGDSLVNLRILVGSDEVDVPQEQLRTPILPPDPVPIKNPRLEPFAYDANPSLVVCGNQPGAEWDDGNNYDNLVQD